MERIRVINANALQENVQTRNTFSLRVQGVRDIPSRKTDKRGTIA